MGVIANHAGVPDGVRRLTAKARAVPERQTGRRGARPPWIARIGNSATATATALTIELPFLGESLLAVGAPVGGRARFSHLRSRPRMQECDPRALGILSLITFLIGLILAFVGAVQLQPFRASIFGGNLVAVAVTREIGGS